MQELLGAGALLFMLGVLASSTFFKNEADPLITLEHLLDIIESETEFDFQESNGAPRGEEHYHLFGRCKERPIIFYQIYYKEEDTLEAIELGTTNHKSVLRVLFKNGQIQSLRTNPIMRLPPYRERQDQILETLLSVVKDFVGTKVLSSLK